MIFVFMYLDNTIQIDYGMYWMKNNIENNKSIVIPDDIKITWVNIV